MIRGPCLSALDFYDFQIICSGPVPEFLCKGFPQNLFFLGKLELALPDMEFPPGNGKGFAVF